MDKIISIFEEIRNTNSKNEKIEIIKSNSDNILFRKCLIFLLDKNITTGINVKKLNKKISNENIINFNSFSDMIDYIVINNTGTDRDVGIVQEFISKQNNKEFYILMLTKNLKIGCDSKIVNKAIPGLIKTFDVMLGKSLTNSAIPEGSWISISHKLNGTRCVFYNGEFYSRQGKKINGLQHIKEDLDILLSNDMVVDGELIYRNSENLSDSEAFQVGTGIVNSKMLEKKELVYVIFDVLTKHEFDNKKSKNTYRERKETLEYLRNIIKNLNIKNVKIVDIFYSGYDISQIEHWLNYAEDNDLEGVMVNLDSLYECKRSKNLLKVKKFYDVDLKIIDLVEGKGKYQNMLGSIIVDFHGNQVNVGGGSGFTDKFRKYYWEHKDELINRIAKIKYKEITSNKVNAAKSLQFPEFIELREKGKEVSYD